MIKLILLLSIIVAACTVQAQLHYSFQKVSPYVYAAIPDAMARVSTTSTVIVGASFITVVEGPYSPEGGRQLIKQIKDEISPLPIKNLILTHKHSDHSLGSGIFKEVYPTITVIAHPYTKTYLADDYEETITFIHDHYYQQKKKVAEADTTKNKAAILVEVDALKAYVEDLRTAKPLPPTLTITDTTHLLDGSLDIQIFPTGHGHTQGDLVIYLPSEKVIITGDLIHDYDPYLVDANPENWIRILKSIETVDFNYLIGGHGGVQQGKQTLISFREYLQELVSKVKAGKQSKISLDQLKSSQSVRTIHALTTNNYGQRIYQAAQKSGAVQYFGFTLEGSLDYSLETLWGYYLQKTR